MCIKPLRNVPLVSTTCDALKEAPSAVFTGKPPFFKYKAVHTTLPHRQTRSILQYLPPEIREFGPIGLHPRAPHSRTFASIQHSELYGRTVGHYARHTSERVDFTHYLTLGNASYGRIAAHLCNLVHIHCYEQGASAYPGRGMRSLATGMAGANYYYIKIKCQFILIVYI